MDKSTDFILVAKTRTQDSIGQYIESVSERTVFGSVGSVSRDEFFAGGEAGFKPELRIVMFGPDYEGEDLAIVDSVYYTIYRTYKAKNDMIELYLERRTGSKVVTTSVSELQTIGD